MPVYDEDPELQAAYVAAEHGADAAEQPLLALMQADIDALGGDGAADARARLLALTERHYHAQINRAESADACARRAKELEDRGDRHRRAADWHKAQLIALVRVLGRQNDKGGAKLAVDDALKLSAVRRASLVVTEVALLPEEFQKEIPASVAIDRQKLQTHFSQTGEIPAGCDVKETYSLRES